MYLVDLGNQLLVNPWHVSSIRPSEKGTLVRFVDGTEVDALKRYADVKSAIETGLSTMLRNMGGPPPRS